MLQPSYWLALDPPQVMGVIGNVVFSFFVLCFVIGIVSRIVASNKRHDQYIEQLGARVGTFLVTMGLLGITLFFLSFERVQFFGARFWYPVWMFSALVWIVFIIRFAKRDIPAMRLRDINRKAINKYLPKRRNKKKKRR